MTKTEFDAALMMTFQREPESLRHLLKRLEMYGLRIVPSEPVAWGQLGMLNGRTYLRENYGRTPYPPPADVARNLNLVPLYADPEDSK